MTEEYEFLWSNFQGNLIIETNIRSFKKFPDTIWNQVNNVVEFSRNNTIRCFHGVKDIQNDKKRGENFLDDAYVDEFFSELALATKKQKELFKKLRFFEISKATNEALFSQLEEALMQWMHIIIFFRSSQDAGITTLLKKVEKIVGEEHVSTLLTTSDLDEINQEEIIWNILLKKDCSDNELLEHTYQFPWIAAVHFTFDEVIETLRAKFIYDKKNPKNLSIIEEKGTLRIEQEKILKEFPEVINYVYTLQKLALSRSAIKSCWAGTDFYIIPLLEEIARRTNETPKNIGLYYLQDEIKNLLAGKKLSEEEISKRKDCFVGLWKNNEAKFFSGEEAERIATKELGDLALIQKKSIIKGFCANKGKVKGIARILQSNNIEQSRIFRKNFLPGQILLTQMTQPNIMDIASRASAIVTDEGGMLSHAAIVSRELGIPCVVGTKDASLIIKDGELIEVDATNGVVRLIE